jgi:hypothetical protein
MQQCPSPKCQSPNVQLLSHYRRSLSPDSDLYRAYAPPAGPEVRVLPGFGLVALGILMLVSGYLPGLAAVAVGGLWLYGVHKATEDAARRRAAWENARVCLACSEKWTP